MPSARDMLFGKLSTAIAAASLLAAAAPARAQTVAVDTTTGGQTALFDKNDWYWAGGFAVATVVMAPLDRAIAQRLQTHSLQDNPFLKRTAVGVRILGSPGAEILSVGTYGVGKVIGHRNVAMVGLHTASSVLVADLITGGIKEVAGRRRPYLSPDNPFDFQLFRGLKGDSVRSFPSGHTTSAFAAAAAISEETGYLWKGGKPYVRVLTYGLASLTGISRVYNNQHWASDVVVGAAIGSFTGWKVVRYTHSHPSNTLDRIFLGRPPRQTTNVPLMSPAAAKSREDRLARLSGHGVPITFTIPTPF